MKVKFSAVVEVPDNTPIDDIEKWLSFELGESGQLLPNAMSDTDLMSAGCTSVYVDYTF